MIKGIIIVLTLTTCVYATHTHDNYNSLSLDKREDFIKIKAGECKAEFDRTRRRLLEDLFCSDLIEESNTTGITQEEIIERINGFNERLYESLLEFCFDNYKGKSYSMQLPFKVGEIKIEDRLLDRLS